MEKEKEAGTLRPPAFGRTESFFSRFYHCLVAGFGLLIVVLIALAPQEGRFLRMIQALLPAAGLGLVALLLKRAPASRPLWILRYVLPFVFLTFYFRLSGQIEPFFPLGRFDELVMRLDGILFGDPLVSMHFQETPPFSNPFFGEFMCAAYVIYYLFIPVFGGILIVGAVWRRPGPSPICAWYVSCVLLTYFLHYFVFFLFPVEGPAFHIEGKVTLDPGFVVNHLHHLIVSTADVPGGCFPSSHVAIAFFHGFVARRLGWRRLEAISFAITAAICFSI